MQSKAVLAEAEDVEALLAMNREKSSNTDVVLLGPVRRYRGKMGGLY